MHCRSVNQKIIRFTFILPLLLFFSVAVVIPFFYGINLSFTDWDSISQEYNYVFLDNYVKAISDSNMRESLWRTIYFGVMYCLINNAIALFIATLLNRDFIGSKITKTLFFIPTCLSAVLAAFIWKFLYSTYFVEVFGASSPLGNPDTVLNAIILLYVWNMAGINIIIYAASLTSVPREFYEAATVDGASTWQKFRNITVPMLMPAFTVCVTLTLTNGMKEFGIILSSTGGGPIDASKVILIYIYDNIFVYYKAGYGQAMSIIFLIFLVVIGTSLSSYFRRREVEL